MSSPGQATSGRRQVSTAKLVAAVLLLAGFAFAVRAIPAPLVLTEDGVSFPAQADELYHMRRIWYTVSNFPAPLPFDRYVAYPDGARIVWPPLFDWSIAALAYGLVGAGDQDAVERVAVWVPPLLGAASVALVAVLGARFCSFPAGLAAGLLLAILPAHVLRSEIGMVDHEVASSLATTLLLGAGMAFLAPARAGPGTARVVSLGLALGAVLWLWAGALLHVGLVGAVLALWALRAETGEAAAARARAVAGVHATAFLVTAPCYLHPGWEQYGRFSPLVLGAFQPTWFAAVALAAAALARLWRRSAWGDSWVHRLGSASALGAVAAGLALLAIPGLGESVRYAAGWFGSDHDDVLAFVAEMQPLLAPQGELRLDVAATRLSGLVFLFPFAWLGLALHARRHALAADRWLLLAWSAAFFTAALAQLRFVNTFVVALALVAGFALDALREPLARRWRSGGARRARLALGVLAILLVALGPVVYVQAARIQQSLQGRRALGPGGLPMRATEQAARFLAEATPPTQGYLDASLQPEYGVLSSWGTGHLVRYRAERPLVQDNFGDYVRRENFEAAWAFYAARDEEEAAAILDRLGVRYVVADPLGAGSAQGYAPGTMTHRMATLLGSAGRARDGAGASRRIPALARHRMVFHLRAGTGTALALEGHYALAVWERVAGARLVGRAAPGGQVQLQLPLRTRQGRSGKYRAEARADADGRFELRVPYATETVPSTAVSVEGPYAIESAGCRATLEVSERWVRNGLELEVPSLVPGPGDRCS